MGMLMELVMGDIGHEGDEPKLIYKGTIITYSFRIKKYIVSKLQYGKPRTYSIVSTSSQDMNLGRQVSTPMTDCPTLLDYNIKSLRI